MCQGVGCQYREPAKRATGTPLRHLICGMIIAQLLQPLGEEDMVKNGEICQFLKQIHHKMFTIFHHFSPCPPPQLLFITDHGLLINTLYEFYSVHPLSIL